MRNLFSWRLRPSEAEFSKLWKDATFVFDTNSLLELYRVSPSLSADFLKILDKIKDRIWLPYQVADEFLKRREGVIADEAKSFEKALKAIEEWKLDRQNFDTLRGHFSDAGRIVGSELNPLLNEQKSYLNAVDDVEKAFREKIEQLTSYYSSLNSDEDIILDKILLLFDSKVGEPFEEETLQELYKEANGRYSQLKPPGYKDKGKDDNKYGDFILWKQTLNFAKKESRPIIFITSEKKEDWWITTNGKIVSPHTELRREFQEMVQQPFWMYRTQRFIKMAGEKLKVEIDPKSIEEMNTIADLEFADEQDNEISGQTIEQIQNLNLALQRTSEMGMHSSALQRDLEQLRMHSSALQGLSGMGRLDPTLQRALEMGRLDLGLGRLDPTLQRALEMGRLDLGLGRLDPTLQGLSGMGRLDPTLQRALEMGRLDPTLQRALEMGMPDSALQRASRMGMPQDKSKSQSEQRKEKLISEIAETKTSDKEKLQEINTQASNNESSTPPIPDKPHEEPKEIKSKTKRRSPSKKRSESNPENQDK